MTGVAKGKVMDSLCLECQPENKYKEHLSNVRLVALLKVDNDMTHDFVVCIVTN